MSAMGRFADELLREATRATLEGRAEAAEALWRSRAAALAAAPEPLFGGWLRRARRALRRELP